MFLDSLPEDIEEIDVWGKGLISLDVTRFKNLKRLNCSNNQLTSLRLNENLRTLYCYQNKVTSLDLNENLRTLYCYDNEFTSLHSENLQALYCSNNRLTSLHLNKNLEILYCSNNRLSSLHLNENLQELYCGKNRLTCLNVMSCEHNLICLNKNLQIHYSNNPIYEIINSDEIDIINRKIQILNDFRYLYYCLKFKKRFRDWLWVRIREPKIRTRYSHDYLVEHLQDNDLDELLEKW